MFVVTSLRGNAKVLLAEVNVDLSIGDGLFQKNVCFGGSKPEESFLNHFGLTCQGTRQTSFCEESHLSPSQEEHCDDFKLMQGLESLALVAVFFSAFLVSLTGACYRSPIFRLTLRLVTIVTLLVAISCASSVMNLLKDSDMVDERSFSCQKVLGADLCYEYGASYVLQWISIGALCIALFLNIILLFVTPATSYTEIVRVPLIQSQTTEG